MEGVKFRIAHVSDLHMAERPAERGVGQWSSLWRKILATLPNIVNSDYRPWMDSYGLHYLRALTRSLQGNSYYNDKPYDGYIFSGDLATTGTRRDIAAAAAYLQARDLYNTSAPPLILPPTLTALVPGNHDRYHGGRMWPTSSEFELGPHFGGDWSIGGKGPTSERVFFNSREFVKGAARLGIVCGDFSYTEENCPRTFFQYWGGGMTVTKTITEMVKLTKDFQDAGTPVIWVTHHAPISRGTGFFLGLQGASELGDAAKNAGVKILLCGHTHTPSGYVFAKTTKKSGEPVRVICAGSATAAGTGERSYYEIVFAVKNGNQPEVRINSLNKIVVKNLGLREQRSQYARKWEFVPLPKANMLGVR